MSTSLPVDDQPAASLLPHLGEDEVQFLAVDLEDRRPKLDFGAFGQRQDRFDNLTRRSTGRQLSGARAMGFANGGKQQVQIARNVGHRADGRSRVAGERLLLDRDHRRQAEHEVDVGLGHLRHESLGVARERLHVPPLPFGVDRVERQARLAGPGESGDDDEAVARDLERDVLQIVDACPLHGDRGPGGGPRRLRALRHARLNGHREVHSYRRTPAPEPRRCSCA